MKGQKPLGAIKPQYAIFNMEVFNTVNFANVGNTLGKCYILQVYILKTVILRKKKKDRAKDSNKAI